MLLRTDETDCKRLVDGPTLNHNHRKPYIPLPPALPRFALPHERSEGGVDPLDVAKTTERPALTSGPRRVVRRRAPVRADATEEVALEDILLEVYAEDPPPPPLPKKLAAIITKKKDTFVTAEAPWKGRLYICKTRDVRYFVAKVGLACEIEVDKLLDGNRIEGKIVV